ASAMFTPDEVLGDLSRWLSGPYRDVIWGRYGLVDSLDLDKKWVSRRVLGITAGAAYISFANLDGPASIWAGFMRIREIQNALKRAQKTRGISRCLSDCPPR
ncbi:MAG TPA: glucoamylase family protein, partial [Bdellovibrionales bacterium]|nr:glucoamylase family protein [Bdellovibrionales bacterium]